MAAAFTIPSVFTAVDRYTAPLRKMQRATRSFATRAQTSMARVERSFRRGLGVMNRAVGGFGLILGGAVLVGGIGNVIGVFKDFEQANATLSSVMASATIPQLKALSDDAKRLGSTTAKSATEVVGLQESFARLGFEAPQIINMTEATIAGSIAMNSELSETADLVGAVVKTFDDFSSIDTPMIVDQMTLSTQKSALSFIKLQTSIPIVAGAASAAGVPFTKLLALLGKLSDSGIDASSSANALKRIFIEAKAKGSDFGEILQSIEKNQDKLTASVDEFGVRAAVSSVILSKNIRETEILDKVLQGAAGTADEAAKKQLATLNGALTILKSSWEGFILSLEDGTGSFSKFLTTSVRVISSVLSIASGVDEAVTSFKEMKPILTENEKRIRSIAESIVSWIKGIGIAIGLFVGLKAALILYNVAIGIAGVLTGQASVAIGLSNIAMKAYKITSIAVTVVQWLWNAAMSAGALAMTILTSPITLIILGIAALIALVVVIIRKWDDWGAALSIILGPLGFVISLIQSFRRNWDMVKDAFTGGGIKSGLLAIGKVILDAILMPVQQLLEILSNIPIVGEFAMKGAEQLEKFRTSLGLETESSAFTLRENERGRFNAVNPAAARQESLERSITESKQNTSITIKDETGRANVESDNDIVPVILTQTFLAPSPF